MAITLRWVGTEELDRVSLTRLRCYAQADKELERYIERARADNRAGEGNYLLAELNGQAVGTATHVPLKMWVRGGMMPCQGVAWVGAIKTMRRRGGDSNRGVASTVMAEVLKRGREREDIVTALMPFRASFYEHFGYGIVERRNEWVIPMPVLPTGPFDSLRFYEEVDFAARSESMRRVNQSGQCDIETSDDLWIAHDKSCEDGMRVVDRLEENGAVRGWMYLTHQVIDGQSILQVAVQFHADADALRRQLNFLSSLRDQYSAVQITLPVDVPLNLLLKETQLPHRPVSHAFVKLKTMTRMQVRVLDHARFLHALKLPIGCVGKANVAVRECEGDIKRFSVDIDGGRAAVGPGGSTADFECPDRIWAAVACGELPATQALRWGLASGDMKAAAVLDVMAQGPAPFCHEYF